MAVGRLIPLGAHEGALNMAIDQAILESVEGGGRPTLRFYNWAKPTLSLGYFQKLADRAGHPQSRDVDCVRRASGGGAIMHDHELTYSLVLPFGSIQTDRRSRFKSNVELYERVHGLLARAIEFAGCRARAFGSPDQQRPVSPGQQKPVSPDPSAAEVNVAQEPFLCFQRRTEQDLIASGYKVVGSAQRRGKGAILQHGSILLKASSHAPQLPGLSDLGGTGVDAETLSRQFAQLLGDSLDLDWQLGRLSESETTRSQTIRAERFASPSWLARR